MDKLYLVFSNEDWLQGSKTLLYIGPDLEKAISFMRPYERSLYTYQNGQLHSSQALYLQRRKADA